MWRLNTYNNIQINGMKIRNVITGSSAHSALGLQTLKEQKLHVSMHVQHKDRLAFDNIMQRKIDHGVENEVKTFT